MVLQTSQLIVFSLHHTAINRCQSLKLRGRVYPGNCYKEKRVISLFLSFTFYFYCRTDYLKSEMETSLLLLGLGLILVGSSGSRMETIKEQFSEEEMQYDIAKNNQEKQTSEVLTNLTLLCGDFGLSMSRDIMSSSLLTFGRLQYGFPKRNSAGNDKEYCNNTVDWRTVSEVNGSCTLSNNFILGSMEVIRGVPKTHSYKSGENLGINCSDSPGLETTMLTMGKGFPKCQYHSVTSLKKILAVLTGHSLMSLLVSGSNL